jgi:carbonic anhydrase/acetyltransferase-like protein (isoleucine patch superfamily)
MIYDFNGQSPRINDLAYIHPSADVIGSVTIGAGCWIGPGARIRGDYGRIAIGNNTSIEDNCVFHARPNEQTMIGEWVTVGHSAIVHNATIHDWAILGMGSIVSDWAVVGEWAVMGEGAVVRQRQEIPAGSIAVGIPARVLERPVDDTYRKDWTRFKEIYAELASRYPKELVARPK